MSRLVKGDDLPSFSLSHNSHMARTFTCRPFLVLLNRKVNAASPKLSYSLAKTSYSLPSSVSRNFPVGLR